MAGSSDSVSFRFHFVLIVVAVLGFLAAYSPSRTAVNEAEKAAKPAQEKEIVLEEVRVKRVSLVAVRTMSVTYAFLEVEGREETIIGRAAMANAYGTEVNESHKGLATTKEGDIVSMTIVPRKDEPGVADIKEFRRKGGNQ